MAQGILFQDIPLEQEQRDLLALLVEAQRSVPRAEWHPYLYEATFGGGSFLAGPGLNHDGVVRSDLDTLAEWGDWTSRAVGQGRTTSRLMVAATTSG